MVITKQAKQQVQLKLQLNDDPILDSALNAIQSYIIERNRAIFSQGELAVMPEYIYTSVTIEACIERLKLDLQAGRVTTQQLENAYFKANRPTTNGTTFRLKESSRPTLDAIVANAASVNPDINLLFGGETNKKQVCTIAIFYCYDLFI